MWLKINQYIRNNSIEYYIFKVWLNLNYNILSKAGSWIVHCKKDSANFQIWIDIFLFDYCYEDEIEKKIKISKKYKWM